MIESNKALPGAKLLERFCTLFGFNYSLAKRYLISDKMDEFLRELKRKLGVD